MSNKDNSSDEFKLITYKRPKKSPKQPNPSDTNFPSAKSLNKDTILKRIQEAKTEVNSSDLLASALASLREGRVDFYNVRVKVYDPVFTEVDCWLLEQFGCLVIKENFEGKYKIPDRATRLFYLPHCPKQLTNNLLWANWGLNLHYCIIVANSFNTVVDNTPKRLLHKSAEYIVNIVPHMIELALINSFRLYEIFNDTAIHIFPWNKLKLLSDDFWCNPEPNYSDDDIEFITNKLASVTNA